MVSQSTCPGQESVTDKCARLEKLINKQAAQNESAAEKKDWNKNKDTWKGNNAEKTPWKPNNNWRRGNNNRGDNRPPWKPENNRGDNRSQANQNWNNDPAFASKGYNTQSQGRRAAQDKDLCYECFEPGHKRQDCPLLYPPKLRNIPPNNSQRGANNPNKRQAANNIPRDGPNDGTKRQKGGGGNSRFGN